MGDKHTNDFSLTCGLKSFFSILLFITISFNNCRFTLIISLNLKLKN